MLSSINWLRQLIARDKAKQPQLKNQLTKSHESSLPTIGRDKLVVFVFLQRWEYVTSTESGRLEVNLSLSGKRGGKSHFLGTILLSAVSGIRRFCTVIRSLLPISLETVHDPKEPVLLIALKIMRYAKLCLSVIMFLICMCWHPERMCRALSTYGQRGQV